MQKPEADLSQLETGVYIVAILVSHGSFHVYTCVTRISDFFGTLYQAFWKSPVSVENQRGISRKRFTKLKKKKNTRRRIQAGEP